jgi:chemotaxis signal transduction protein
MTTTDRDPGPAIEGAAEAAAVVPADLLRREFDRSFAIARQAVGTASENLLAVRIGGDRYAFRLSQIGALYADRPLTPLPSPVAELLGLASFRSELAPVYDLGALLGYGPRSTPRWLVLAAPPQPVGFAFDLFEAQVAVPVDRIFQVDRSANAESAKAAGAPERTRRHLMDAAQTDDGVRPIIDLVSVAEQTRRRAEELRRATEEIRR